jgi:hypothetical protein
VPKTNQSNTECVVDLNIECEQRKP